MATSRATRSLPAREVVSSSFRCCSGLRPLVRSAVSRSRNAVTPASNSRRSSALSAAGARRPRARRFCTMTSRLTKSTASSIRSRTSASTSESKSRIWPGRVRKGTAPSDEDAGDTGGQRWWPQPERREEWLRVARVVLFEHPKLIWRDRKSGETVEQASERAHRAEGHVDLADAAPPHGSADDVEQLQHRDGVAAGSVERVFLGDRHPHRTRERFGDELDGHGLQACPTRADDGHDGQTAQHPCEHRDEAVAVAVDDRRPEDRPREAARANGFFGSPLGLVIARPCARPRPERTHVDEAPHTGLDRRVQDVDRALDVDALERGVLSGMLANDPDEMDDGVAAGDVGIEAPPHQNVALDALDSAESLEVALRATTDEAAHGMTFGAEGLDHCPTHKARPSGDEHPSHDGPIP